MGKVIVPEPGVSPPAPSRVRKKQERDPNKPRKKMGRPVIYKEPRIMTTMRLPVDLREILEREGKRRERSQQWLILNACYQLYGGSQPDPHVDDGFDHLRQLT